MVSLRDITKIFNKPPLSQEEASTMLFAAMMQDDGEAVLRIAQERPDSVYWPGFGDDPAQDKALIPFDYALRFGKTASAAAMAAAVPALLTDVNVKGQNRLFLETLSFDKKSAALKVLIKIGADVKHTDNEGNSLLHVAATVRDSEDPLEQALLALKNTELRNNKGETAIMTAAAAGATWNVSLLIEHDAEKNATDNAGLNATMHALLNGHANIARTLLAQGGKIDFAHESMTPETIVKIFAAEPDFVIDIEKRRHAWQRAENEARRAALSEAIVTSVSAGVGEITAPGRAAFRKKKQPSREI